MYNGVELIKRIDDTLKKHDKKRKDLCDYCSISTQAITNWSNRGSVPSIEIIMKAAEYLQVSLYWLLTAMMRPG
jgi:transcriptional regulator with XRE-family HTH domain